MKANLGGMKRLGRSGRTVGLGASMAGLAQLGPRTTVTRPAMTGRLSTGGSESYLLPYVFVGSACDLLILEKGSYLRVRNRYSDLLCGEGSNGCPRSQLS